MFEIINTLTEKDIKEDFVAIGSYVDGEKIASHSVLIIKYKDQVNQFHYTSIDILFDNVYNDSCFHKITNTIHPVLIPSLIIMCKRVMKSANPRYGYFYSGEYYDENGDHFSEKQISETMTCTGFCLNILKGHLEEDYLLYKEWNTPTYPSAKYLERYAKKYNLDIDKISESHRRISPVELLSSAFFSEIPISKSQVDSKVDQTREYLKNY